MWAIILLIGLAAAKPLDEVYQGAFFDSINPEYGDLYEGDIIVDDAEAFEDLELSPMVATKDPRRKWPNNILHYTIGSEYSSSQRQTIVNGINDFMSKTSINGRRCVTLAPRTNQAAYVAVEKGSGCSSALGRTGRRQRLSLANGCLVNGIVIHEFLHALGFFHEQSRPDRDDWVTIDFNNIVTGREGNFRKQTTSQATTLGRRYDYGSVMHYGAFAFAKDRNRPTIIAKRSGGNQMGQRRTMSALDIEKLQVHYGCRNARDSVYFKHLADIPEYNRADEWLANTELDN